MYYCPKLKTKNNVVNRHPNQENISISSVSTRVKTQHTTKQISNGNQTSLRLKNSISIYGNKNGSATPQLKLNNPKKFRKTINSKKLFEQNICGKSFSFQWDLLSFIGCSGPQKQSQYECSCGFQCYWADKWTKCKKNNKLYQKLQQQNPNPKHLKQIEKDLHRTYAEEVFFQNSNILEILKNVLISYSIYDHQVGYVQGMNMIVAAILYHLKKQEDTFWFLVQIMEGQELRKIFLQGFQKLNAHIENIKQFLQQKASKISQHFNKIGMNLEIFLYGWLLSLFTNCIPLNIIGSVLDGFSDYGWNFIYKLVLQFLRQMQEKILMIQDQSELIQTLNNKNCISLGQTWNEIIRQSLFG